MSIWAEVGSAQGRKQECPEIRPTKEVGGDRGEGTCARAVGRGIKKVKGAVMRMVGGVVPGRRRNRILWSGKNSLETIEDFLLLLPKL